jgi:hypothetical protein
MPENGRQGHSEKVIERLDKIISLMQDLFILEGILANADKDGLRKILAIDKKRINRISKLIKKTD